MSDTVYPVKLVYTLQDSASRGLDNIAGHAKDAADHTDILSSSLGHLAALAAGAFGLHKATEAFIGFNAELETMQIQARTMILGNKLAESWDEAGQSAKGMISEFQRFAITSPVTTKEIMEFSNGVGVAVAQAGGSLKEITNFAEQGVIAAKALGAESGYAALELTEGIQRGVTARQRFLKQLLPMGNVTEEEFNKAIPLERLHLFQQAINSPAMKHAAEAFGHSFTGVKSTLEDIWQLTAGAAGKEVFGAITDEIRSWNEWLLKNTDEVEHIKEIVSHALVGGFREVKHAVAWIAEHYEAIKTLVEALLLLKGVGMIGGAISNVAGFASSIEKLGSASLGAGEKLTGMATAATNTVAGLAILYTALQAAAHWLDEWQQKDMAQKRTTNEFDSAIRAALGGSKSAQREVYNIAAGAGAVTSGGDLDTKKMREYLASKMGESSPAVQLQELDMVARVFKRMPREDLMPDDIRTIPKVKKPEETKKSPTTVNIHVARVEVKSDDPDRFAIALVDLGRRSLARPTQALTAPRI